MKVYAMFLKLSHTPGLWQIHGWVDIRTAKK